MSPLVTTTSPEAIGVCTVGAETIRPSTTIAIREPTVFSVAVSKAAVPSAVRFAETDQPELEYSDAP